MDRVTTDDARGCLDDLVDRVASGEERIILTRDGQEVAALVHVEDARWLQEREDQYDREAIAAAMAEVEEKGTIPWEQVKSELGL